MRTLEKWVPGPFFGGEGAGAREGFTGGQLRSVIPVLTC